MFRSSCISKTSYHIAALLVLTAASAAAQQAAGTLDRIALVEGGFVEDYHEGALISGAVVPGVVFSAEAQGRPVLRGYIPSGWADEIICASVTSIDGLYSASGAYKVPPDQTGAIELLPFPTEYEQLLSEKRAEEIAVRIVLGLCGGAQPTEFSLALWNAEEASSVAILVNSFRAEAVFAYVEGREKPIRCTAIENDHRTAFDSRCEIELSGTGQLLEVEIYRIVDGKPARPDPLTIHIPKN